MCSTCSLLPKASHSSSQILFLTPIWQLFSLCVCPLCFQALGRKWEPRHHWWRVWGPALHWFLLPLWRTSRQHMKTERRRLPGSWSNKPAVWSAVQGRLISTEWVHPKYRWQSHCQLHRWLGYGHYCNIICYAGWKLGLQWYAVKSVLGFYGFSFNFT